MKFNVSKFTNKVLQKRNRTLLLAFIIGCIVCLLLIVGVVKVNHTTHTKMISNYPIVSTSSPMTENVAARTTYIDPHNYFRISIPVNWRTEQESGTNTAIDNTTHQLVTQQIEISKLYLFNTEGITIQVYNGVPMCPLKQSLTTILAGFPASYDGFFNTWTIPTTKATVTVSIFYPGSGVNYQEFMQNGTSQLSSSEIENNKSYIKGILNTLVLTNLTPYSCK